MPVDGSSAFWGLELVWAEMRNLEASLHSSLPASSVASSVAGSSDEFNNSDTNGGYAAQQAGGAHGVREEREQYDSFMHHQVLQLVLHGTPRRRSLTCVFTCMHACMHACVCVCVCVCVSSGAAGRSGTQEGIKNAPDYGASPQALA